MKRNAPAHGTQGMYTNHNCRCDDCRRSNTQANKTSRLRRQNTLTEDDPRHGKYSTYLNYMCRCVNCKLANAAASRRREANRKNR